MVFDPSIIPSSQQLMLTLDSSVITADQSDFPLAIYLDSTEPLHSSLFTDLGSNSKKLSIQSGSTQLPVEIEWWDSVNGKAVLHTKVPTYTYAADANLVLSYDSTQDDNSIYVGDIGSTAGQSVWNSGYDRVYHLCQDPSTGGACMLDSTANARHATPNGTMTSGDLVDGPYGSKAIDFDGSNDYLLSPGTVPNGPCTITALFSYNANATTKGLIGTGGTPLDNAPYFILQNNSGALRAYAITVAYSETLVTITTGTWYTAGIARSTTDERSIIDGAFVNSRTVYTTGGATNLYIGCGYNGYSNVKVKEVRVSTVQRSDEWEKLTKLALADQLITWSYINKVSGTVTVNGSPAARTVAVFRRSDFTLLGTTTSDASTGAFEILGMPLDANALLVTAIDSTGTYNAVSVDYITSVSP